MIKLQGTTYTGFEKIENALITVEDHNIMSIHGADKAADDAVVLPADYKIVPGFIDVHIHGANGADVMDGTKEALDTMSQALPQEGTTSYLATTMTESRNRIDQAIENVGHYLNKEHTGQAEVIGIHLEGPFINPDKAGAQPLDAILTPNMDQFQAWQRMSGGMIKLVTVAPEMTNGQSFVKHLSEHNVVASIGHSNGSMTDIKEAVSNGATHVTHLFNGMRGMHHREPGVVGGAYYHDQLYTELIADGIHVHPDAVHITYKTKGKDRLVLITDAMRAKCLKNGHYDLGGQDVTVKDGEARLDDGTLAGSVLQMKHGFQNMLTFTDAAIEDLVYMTAMNPAKQAGVIDRKGTLEPGKDADMTILDHNNDVYMTICRGEIVFQREELTT
ncbi:N-acetylglucosamine-6-phosphate deacetylase [Tuberibacillus sp. Marseille-P3662]|uniref:N-acetylglucosamine-6-phosphate deacetylase n=1 Tax=Tuberibacillus sp. Marseille-P3662 TaxID=1965358 RepID=UPI000A1C847F|nr:N-acetylglucosamine-6-phosphate deacetylase [Tuberibacillus sp. Marseille-P3662]